MSCFLYMPSELDSPSIRRTAPAPDWEQGPVPL